MVKKRHTRARTLRRTLMSDPRSGSLGAHRASYMWLCFEHITGRLDGEWRSHGVLIGEAGGEVTPRNLVHYVEGEDGAQYAAGNPGNRSQWLRALALILSPIRLNTQLRREYLDALTVRYKATIEEFAGMRVNDSPGTFALQHSAWTQNTTYLRLAASLDMFLSKFRDHEHSKLRFATVTTRFRDCAGVGDLRFILKILGLTLIEFSKWIWTASLADDIERILRPGEEIDQRDSYTPYVASMRLCTKSPYSATANPNLHIFVHSIGCANLRVRSINARMVGDVNLADTIANAAVVNYVRGSRYNLQPEFFRPGSIMAPEGARAGLEEQSAAGSLDLELMSEAGVMEGMQRAAEPADMLPHSWWKFIVANQATVPAYIIGPMYVAWTQISSVRSGTIGEHLKAFGALKLGGQP
ncbi:AAEL009525-PA [Aedes aegypti]|uniref:AAEL009525-PA n=1 Tax=Aedes aegypti TaxID=7159 RepID=Q16VL5_AEDAE|nr:AAEL009525-PA [Aedes aegypti]